MMQGVFYLQDPGSGPEMWAIGLMCLVTGALLLVGFLTPIAGVVGGLCVMGLGLSLIPVSKLTVFDSKPAVVFAAAMLIGVVVLGPGAFSLDARLFGRREIIIPPSMPRLHQ
jgi:uncharacterized membrane protein YphA (DoxX/SURF4 family)